MFPKFRRPTSLQGIHLFAKGYLKTIGYRWELRRHGEVRLGYWKKIYRAKDPRSAYPRRFVLVPGFGDTALSWYGVLVLLQPFLKSHFDEVVLLDFPGFGGFLSKDRAFPSMDLMRNVVSDTLDSLKPHTILGHSLGGWLAGYYASQWGQNKRPFSNPHQFSGPELVILANPSGIFKDLEVQNQWETLFRSTMEKGFQNLRPHLFAKEPFWFRGVSSHFSQFLKREDILQFMNSFREEHLLEKEAHHIQAQVWLLWGEKDSLIPASCSEKWLEALRKGPRKDHAAVLLRRSGHSPHIEEPAVTAAAIAQIISNRLPHRLGNRWWKVIQPEALLIS